MELSVVCAFLALNMFTTTRRFEMCIYERLFSGCSRKWPRETGQTTRIWVDANDQKWGPLWTRQTDKTSVIDKLRHQKRTRTASLWTDIVARRVNNRAHGWTKITKYLTPVIQPHSLT